MKISVENLYRVAVLFGVDWRKTARTLKGLPRYFSDLKKFKLQLQSSKVQFELGHLDPCLDDQSAASGKGRGHYFHQDLLVARRIYLNKPAIHMDVGSRIDGFVAHVASFRTITVLDIRPLKSDAVNVQFMQADLMNVPGDHLIHSCDSLSCLHALEHFGLGRYGDPLSYEGYLVGLDNLFSLLKPQGKFYFSAPIGPQRVEFNAQRVFSIAHLLQCFKGRFTVDQFSYVDDLGDLHENFPLQENDILNNCGCRYGCGIFEMTKTP